MQISEPFSVEENSICDDDMAAKIEFLQLREHAHNTRYSSKSNYYIKPTNLRIGRRTMHILGPKIWAQVPYELKQAPTNLFAKKLKNHMLSKYLNDTDN